MVLEKAGIPAIPVLTDAFDATAREMARLWGVPDFRFLMVPHPLASLNSADIEQRVDVLLAKVLELLQSGQPE